MKVIVIRNERDNVESRRYPETEVSGPEHQELALMVEQSIVEVEWDHALSLFDFSDQENDWFEKGEKGSANWRDHLDN